MVYLFKVGQRHRTTRTAVRRSLEVQTAMRERQTTSMMRRCVSKLELLSSPPPPQAADMHIPPILLVSLGPDDISLRKVR
ncbi:hypothetical protein F2Q70_00005883 [Brassica cretica]|uniref:Uncharacterized protein n=1 Tax=Brassica cretica TaxID=69181 RepID=A0A8S9IXK2_BRACR|nr:hypothetical protein F2Q70_00005883 [Brassica cretica]